MIVLPDYEKTIKNGQSSGGVGPRMALHIVDPYFIVNHLVLRGLANFSSPSALLSQMLFQEEICVMTGGLGKRMGCLRVNGFKGRASLI